MKKVRQFIECFVTVTTGIVVIAAISYHGHSEDLTSATLWQILLSAALCSLSTALFFPDENASKTRIWVGIILHFLSLCAIMLYCGRQFGWVGPTFWDAAVMVGYVVIIYAFTTLITFIMEKQEAAQLNQQLQKKYHSPPTTE